jgi:hypothetical protein
LIPNTLNDWTYEAIQTLCAAGQSESDRHDFEFGLADPRNATKICCAFANTFGGFIVVGVKDISRPKFEIIGLDPDKELYGNFLAKVKADPNIDISPPKAIRIPGSAKLLYVFEVAQSTRRPHLPSPPDLACLVANAALLDRITKSSAMAPSTPTKSAQIFNCPRHWSCPFARQLTQSACDEFTVSYGISVADREQMLAMIQSVSKRQLARAAHVSIRTIPSSLADANEMPDKELRRILVEASALAEEKRKISDADEALLRWLVRQVGERGLKKVAELLAYDAANLAKVVAGRRQLSGELRKRIRSPSSYEMSSRGDRSSDKRRRERAERHERRNRALT